jgi:hypothetical protein
MDKLPKIVPPKNKGEVPCGLYRTTRALSDNLPENVLVYYHNHGDPGPGVYPVKSWNNNKAKFQEKGITLDDSKYAKTMKSLKTEGFYRVTKNFYCCDNHCFLFERDTLVQLGYNGDGKPIVFIPELHNEGLLLPQKGNLIDDEFVNNLKPLRVMNKLDSGVEGSES